VASWIGPALVAAIVSALVTMAGWLVSHQRDLRVDARRRRERVVDLQTALRAEIRSRRQRFAAIDLAKHGTDTVARMTADDSFVPFVPNEVQSFIFGAVAKEIHVLPTEVIDPAVLYYQQCDAIAQFVLDLRSDRFHNLESPRRIAMFKDYIAMNVFALELADAALSALDQSIPGGPAINSWASARSAPGSGAAGGEAPGADRKT
jgi:hypothetical protein